MEVRSERKYRLNLSWDYDKEEAWLNELSSQGLHLKKAGFLSGAFSRDESARYTYSLDYQPGFLKHGKLQEYIDLYQDAGWEYVCTYGGIWHYFRRAWQPGETPRLYTDMASLVTHYRKIQRMMGIMLLLNMGIFLMNMMNLLLRNNLWTIVIPVVGIYVLLLGLFLYGYVKMGRKISKLTR
nr:DUF2812 domain-containing protein [Cohnella sp. CFH 77786]